MAAPNLVALTTITAKATHLSLADANATVLLSNAAASAKVLRVTSVVVANDDGTNSVDVTLSINSAAAGAGTAYKLAHLVTVLPKTSVVLIDKTTSLYLEEDRSLVITASAGNDLDVVASYEEIS